MLIFAVEPKNTVYGLQSFCRLGWKIGVSTCRGWVRRSRVNIVTPSIKPRRISGRCKRRRKFGIFSRGWDPYFASSSLHSPRARTPFYFAFSRRYSQATVFNCRYRVLLVLAVVLLASARAVPQLSPSLAPVAMCHGQPSLDEDKGGGGDATQNRRGAALPLLCCCHPS